MSTSDQPAFIPYGRQTIDDQDIRAVQEALKSDWLTTGPGVSDFEQAFARYTGVKHAIAVNNGTSALHLAMLVAEIGAGDRVVTTPNTFLASANCAAYVDATADFSDIDPLSYNLCPDTLAANWQADTRAVVAVDYAGQTADMPAIADVARRKGAVVIEDACHAIGGQFEHEGRLWRVGGHPWADITTFSFHPVKTMTTGEGGMLVTDSDSYAERARLLRHHGMLRAAESFVGLGDAQDAGFNERFSERGPWYYEMQEVGFNFRITDVQCALGLSQLTRLDRNCARRREIVDRYNSAFEKYPAIQTPALRNPADRSTVAWHLYTILLEFGQDLVTRTEFMQKLRAAGIGSQVLYIPVHLQPWYRERYGYKIGKCPVAENFYQRALSLPLYPAMTDADVDRVIHEVIDCVG